MTFLRKIIGKGSGQGTSTGKTCPTCGRINPLPAKFCSSCGSEFAFISNYFDAFISYRRESGSDLASLLKIHLENRFNKKVFLDVNELQVGRFDEELLSRIEATPNFIVILSRASLDRCANKNDWLKREIMHALQTGRNIIPVMTDGFAFPSDEIWALLPPEMRIISTLNGVLYSHVHQDSAIRKIASYLKHEAGNQENKSGVFPEPPTNIEGKGEATNPAILDGSSSNEHDPRKIEQSGTSLVEGIEKKSSEVIPQSAPSEPGKKTHHNPTITTNKKEPDPAKASIGRINFIPTSVENLNTTLPYIGNIQFVKMPISD